MSDKIRILLFVLLLSGLTVASFVKKPVAFSETENRYLEQKPEFSMDALWDGSFTKDYEAYITDQFPGRNEWIGIKTQMELLMLRRDINGVYFGKDHYLMEKHGYDTFESQQAEKNATYLARFLEKYHSRYTPEHLQVLFVPTASQVLTDKLPPMASPYDQTEYVKRIADKIAANVGRELPEYLLYAGDSLSNHAEEYIYYRTDHHWTTLGAFYAYQAWCTRMNLTAYQADDFTLEEATREFYGTLDSKVNTVLMPDTMYLYHLDSYVPGDKKPNYTLTYDRSEDVRNNLYDYCALEGKDKYAVYLGGNYGEVDIQTNLSNGKTLLVIKDSYAHSFVPFAVNHYERVLMIDMRYFNVALEGYLEENGVTDVLVLYNLANVAIDKNLGKIMR